MTEEAHAQKKTEKKRTTEDRDAEYKGRRERIKVGERSGGIEDRKEWGGNCLGTIEESR